MIKHIKENFTHIPDKKFIEVTIYVGFFKF